MICVEINHTMQLLQRLYNTGSISVEKTADTGKLASAIASSLCGALKEIVTASAVSSVALPYEMDGNGAVYYMDDANVPSLLSLPVLGFISSSHSSYQTTRNLILSPTNPFYYSGKAANGIGGPHVGTNYTWPMSIVIRAMTSQDVNEIATCLSMLAENTAGTGLMHESFDVNNSNQWTRSWFAWANGLFGELVLQLIHTNPTLVLKNDPETIALAQSLVKKTVSMEAQVSPLIA
jgi:meiotically up-regulated gene 157 (Mug157) protein